MAKTIGELAYIISADASRFTQGMTATRTELALSRKLFTDTRTETEKAGLAIDRVGHLYRKGAIDLETYNRALKQLHASQSMMGRMGGMFSGMTVGSLAAGFGITTGIAGVAHVMRDTMQVSMEFEKSMSRVNALLTVGSGATQEQVDALGQLARQLGSETVFTARDAAEAMQFFALAGFKASQITQAMKPTLDLAAAGQLSIAESANIATIVMSGMGIEASELGFVVDVLTNAMTSANTDLQQLGDAMRFVGPIAKASGQSLGETVAAIQLLSNAGMQGEMAGTALRGILMKLADPTNEATGALEDLGVKVLDDAGNMRELADIIDDLNAEFDRLGLGTGERMQRLGSIFEARAATGFVALMEQGGDVLRELNDHLGQTGSAAAVADKQLANLAGSVEKVKGSWEELQIAVSNDKTIFRFAAETANFWLDIAGDAVKGEASFDSLLESATEFLEAVDLIEKRPRLVLDKDNFGFLAGKAAAAAGGEDLLGKEQRAMIIGDDGANAADGMAGLTKDQRDLIAAGNVLLDTLFKEQEHFGKTSEEIELMRLKTEGLGDVSDDLVGSIEKQIDAVKELREEKKKQAEEDREVAAAMAMLGSLDKRRSVLEGFSEDEMKISEWLGRDIIDDETAQSMRSQIRENENLERRNKEQDELKRLAGKIADSTLTPGQKLGQEFSDIQRALDAGLLTNEEAKLASDKATEDFNKDFKRNGRGERTNIAGGALERGSAEAFSAILRAGDKGKNEQTELQKQELEIAKQMLEALKAREGNPLVVNVLDGAP